MLEPNQTDIPETKEELIPVTFQVRSEDLSAIYNKYSQHRHKLRNDIDRLVRELKEAKWGLKQTTAKLEKSEKLTRQLQIDNKTYKDRLSQAATGSVVSRTDPALFRELHLKDATITRLQAEIADIERMNDDTDKLYRASLEDNDRLNTQVKRLEMTVHRLRAERNSLANPLDKLLKIWDECNGSDE